ncbi:MAG: hypothetical protein EBY28_16905 [Betaproteobacteria bacterium]|nr:hypothetical protein [Betaproteobacteria bacterium]
MHTQEPICTKVMGVVREVLPKFGLAYLEDQQGWVWVVTASCAGPGLATMQPGDIFQLKLAKYDDKTFVSSYASSYQRMP